MPDDAAFALADAVLGGFDGCELVGTGDFLFAAVEDDEVTNQVKKSRFFAEFGEGSIEEGACCEGCGVVRFPGDKHLCVGSDRAVIESLGVVACEDELDGAEEAFVEDGFLVADQLLYAVANIDRATFEFDQDDCNPIQVDNEIRAAFVSTFEGDFFGNREVVGFGVFPVDEVDGFVGFVQGDLDLGAVAQECVGAEVGLVEGDTCGVGGGFEFLEGGGDLGGGVAAIG